MIAAGLLAEKRQGFLQNSKEGLQLLLKGLDFWVFYLFKFAFKVIVV